MRARFILETDPLASIEANLEFLRKCEKQIQAKKEQLKGMTKIPQNQVDLEDLIKRSIDEDNERDK